MSVSPQKYFTIHYVEHIFAQCDTLEKHKLCKSDKWRLSTVCAACSHLSTTTYCLGANQILSSYKQKGYYLNGNRILLFDHTVTFFLTVLAIKCLIAVPLSHMCYLCLTLPSPHGRWYNGCCESRSHLQDGKKELILLSWSKDKLQILPDY